MFTSQVVTSRPFAPVEYWIFHQPGAGSPGGVGASYDEGSAIVIVSHSFWK